MSSKSASSPTTSSSPISPSQLVSNRSNDSSDPHNSHVMSAALIADICKKKGGYRTPELNEHLYLHFRGFSAIHGLEAYVNCRVLWLENNNLESMTGLETLSVLHALYLQHNCFSTLVGTPLYASIRAINLSHNKLTSLDGIEALPNLEKLLVSHNEIENCVQVSALSFLQVLDLSHNRIRDAVLTREVVSKCKALASLMLQGNPELSTVKYYRKTLIVENKQLRYLDEYPVFEDERRKAVAFIAGGWEQEREEKCKIDAEEVARQMAQRAFFQQVLENARAKGAADENDRESTAEANETALEPQPAVGSKSVVKPTTYFQQMEELEHECERNRESAEMRPSESSRVPKIATKSISAGTRTNERRFTVLPTIDDDNADAIYVPVGLEAISSGTAALKGPASPSSASSNGSTSAPEGSADCPVTARCNDNHTDKAVTRQVRPKHFDCSATDNLAATPPYEAVSCSLSQEDGTTESSDNKLAQRIESPQIDADVPLREVRTDDTVNVDNANVADNIRIEVSVKESLAAYFSPPSTVDME